MHNIEDWVYRIGSPIILVLLINEGGFEILKHPVWFSVFILTVGGTIFWFCNLFCYSSRKEKLKTDKSQSKKVNDKTSHLQTTVNRNDCAELLTSKGYELYRGLNMIYSVTPIGSYDNDAVFRSKRLNEIYEFALNAKNLTSPKN